MNKKLLLCIFLLYFPACETLYGISPKALIQFISEHTESLCYVYEVTPTSIKYFTAAILAKYLVDKLLTTFIKYEFTSDFLLNCLYYMGARADAQLLRTACMDNNTALALRCLKYGADPRKAVYMLPSPLSIEKCRGKIHYTNALHLATHHNNTDVINALYVKGADINNLDYKGETPLLFANTDETIKLLINKGALAPYVLPAEQRSHVVKEHEHFSDPTILGLILGKLQKNMIINDEIKNFVTRVCNDEIKCDTATVDLFDFCSKKCPLWIRELYDCLYRHIEESDCNALLLKLFNHDHTSQKFDHITFQAVIVHDDVQFIEKIIEKVKEKNWFKAKEPLYYLQKACQRRSKNVISYIYQNHKNWHISEAVIWHTAASKSLECLQHLLSLPKTSRDDLHRKNEYHQTVFYTAVTNNIITDTKIINEDIGFLTKELEECVAMTQAQNITTFVNFCVNNGAQGRYIAAQKAKERILAHCNSLADDENVCFPICGAFKSILSEEEKKQLFPSATS